MTTSPKRQPRRRLRQTIAAPGCEPAIKLYRRRIAIDHPDPKTGERLLADALGAVDRDALHGILSNW